MSASMLEPSGDVSVATPSMTQPEIRPFTINIPEEILSDLRSRILATRWPDKETVSDRSQGVQLAKLRPLVEYWGIGYDWREVEATLNALPQFVTEIDGLDIQFAHIRSPHWEGAQAGGGPFNAFDIPTIPVAVTVFPAEIYQAPRSWGGQSFGNLIY